MPFGQGGTTNLLRVAEVGTEVAGLDIGKVPAAEAV